MQKRSLPHNHRQYKTIFGTDYARAEKALKGKDAVTIQKEAFAVEVAKQKGTTPAEEYKWVSNGIDLGWLGEFEGWGRTIKGLPRGVSSNEKLPVVSKTSGYVTTNVTINDNNVWSSTKKQNSRENVISHWEKHKSEFPELSNVNEYLNSVHSFINSPPKGTLIKERANGDTLFYHPDTRVFISINKEKVPRTMFRPAPNKHGYKSNEEYFNAQ